ncbi:transmembrane and TPR repeat-containing protein 4-like [Trichoplusia ni]|uniref:dolichyl-phosphate-mannose--protein mannosyltransferase n=1 Tax=Trichoplusia ni TaxID=7111 RepID=A0A7E5VGH1_TRINI|nr:transmembrane and TPR repeat-containing protein 4-like [Trichoplusia ni]
MAYKLLCIISLSSLPYLFTLTGDFVFDDSEAVVKNKDVITDSWTEPFFNDFWGANIKSNLSHKSYRPLTILSFRINYWLNNKTLSAFQFKATNLICHVICCILVWKVYQSILYKNNGANITYGDKTKQKLLNNIDENKRKWWMDQAYLSSLLFAVHPVHVEAVSGVVGRADLLAAITFFLAFLFYKKSMTSHTYKYIYLFFTVLLSGISMLCKENGITVLGFCLAYEVIFKFRIWKRDPKVTKTFLNIKLHLSMDSVIRISIITVAIIGLLYGRWLVMAGTKPEFKPIDNPAAFADSLFTKVATYNYVYFLNLLLFIWPKWLCYDWSMGCIQLVQNLTDSRIILIAVMYLYGFLLLKSVISRKNMTSHSRTTILAVSLIVIPFLPASNIFYPVGFVIAERILYIPSAGYCLLIVIGFRKLLTGRKLLVCKSGVLIFLLLLLVYSARSWQRSMEWQNEYALFVSGLKVCPLNAKVHYNVAKAADANHQVTWALAEYKEAIRLYPEYYQAMNNLANILKNQKQFGEAEFFFRSAVKLKRDFPAAWMNLGILLANTNRFEESEQAYKTAISYRRKYPDCFYNLGNLYLEMNKTEEAIDSWFQAINENPKHILAWTNVMALMDNTGQIDRALKVIPKVLTELPEAPSINFAIANMYGKINRYEEAERHFIKAIKLFDTQVQALHYANLGVLYHRWKKNDLAEEMYKKALKIDPKFKTARKNLESLFRHKNK